MAELADLVERVKGVLYGSRPDLRPRMDYLEVAVNDTLTDMEFATPSLWQRDDFAEFQPDGEIVYLRTDHPASGSVAVYKRGADGTRRDQRFGAMPHHRAAHCGQEEACAYLEPLARARLNETGA